MLFSSLYLAGRWRPRRTTMRPVAGRTWHKPDRCDRKRGWPAPGSGAIPRVSRRRLPDFSAGPGAGAAEL